MAQVFPKTANEFARASLVVGGLVAAAVLGSFFFIWPRSSYMTRQREAREQPVPFYHMHHVGGMGIDCRYCHTSVEESAFANIPPTKTCMNCHSQIWTNAPILEPVRASYRENRPLQWIRVHDLPDFVYFNHSIHVAKGVGCSTCHGQIDRMPLVYQEARLQMSWCLNCHRNPDRYIRPKSEVFNMSYQRPADDPGIGQRLVKEYNIADVRQLTSCSTCHR